MRTLSEITESIKSQFVANSELAELYRLDRSKTFDEQFSKVSFEALIIYIVAAASYVLERTFATTVEEVDTAIDSRYVASIPWFQQKALEYQDGYDLVFDNVTRSFGYAASDPKARIIAFAAVRTTRDANEVQWVQILVSKEGKAPLTEEEMLRFSRYMQRISPAGTRADIVSKQSDLLQISAQVNYNPLLLTSEGLRITDGSSPVNEAIQTYIDNIKYGGTFNKTKLVDAIQAAEGVVDVILLEVEVASADGEFVTLAGNSYPSSSGSFVINDIIISYLAEDEDTVG